jgi:hypothetical protein
MAQQLAFNYRACSVVYAELQVGEVFGAECMLLRLITCCCTTGGGCVDPL